MMDKAREFSNNLFMACVDSKRRAGKLSNTDRNRVKYPAVRSGSLWTVLPARWRMLGNAEQIVVAAERLAEEIGGAERIEDDDDDDDNDDDEKEGEVIGKEKLAM